MSNGLHESSGSYAVHALDAAELAEYEAHLATCATCPGEVDDFCETAAELSLLVEATPPAGMRSRILDSIAGLPQLPTGHEDTVVRPLRRAERSTGPRRAAPGSELVEEPEPQIDELALRRQRRRSRFLSGLVAAMLALAVGLGGVVYSLVQERQTQVASQRLEEELLRAPDVTVVRKAGRDGGRATFVVSKDLDRALFLGTDLPDPGPGLRYQLWTGTGDPSSLDKITDVFLDNPVDEAGPESREFLRGDIDRAEFLAISIEEDGSTPSTPNTEQIVVAAPLPT